VTVIEKGVYRGRKEAVRLNGGTHAALGLGAGVVAASTMQPELPTIFLVTAGVVSALIPDLDEEKSMIYNYTMKKVDLRMRRPLVGLIGIVLLFFSALELSHGFLLAGAYFLGVSIFRHRTFSHSLLGLVMMTGFAHEVNPDLTAAVFLGYLSHLLADSLTIQGIPWLWPYPRRYRMARIQTGSLSDHMIGLVALFLALAGWASL
jgi:inner membrane protein